MDSVMNGLMGQCPQKFWVRTTPEPSFSCLPDWELHFSKKKCDVAKPKD